MDLHQTVQILQSLEAGTYTLTIEDKEGYTFNSHSYTITQPEVLSITKDVEKNISCFNGNDGAIEVTISGGTLPYTYNWTTVDGSGILPNAEKQNELTAGNYTLEIIDKNNCTISTNVAFLHSQRRLKIEMVLSKQDVLCFGDASGTIEINVTGGDRKRNINRCFRLFVQLVWSKRLYKYFQEYKQFSCWYVCARCYR